MKNNVKTYLGFAVKKGSVIYGLDAMERQNKAPYAVLLCPTAAQNTAKKTAEYCKTCFADDVCGEWYGYLRRDGKPTEPPCKGSTFKGPFHVPRSLIMADVLLGDILEG